MKPTVWIPMAAVALASTANAQSGARTVPPRIAAAAPLMRYLSGDEPNAARIGVYLGDNGIRDTLGVLVTSVVKDGPADKAGIREGDRVIAINGINLKMTRDDADDPSLSGMMSRRLTREMDKRKPGDDIELHVWSGNSAKTLHVQAVAARDLETAAPPQNDERPMQTFRNDRNDRDDRGALGINLGGTVTKRDTLGVFIAAVVADGPADKAGIVEGERIARVNGTDLRVPASDAGDAELSRARMSRFNRELAQVRAGDAVTLTVVNGGHSREVRVMAVKASELPHTENSFFFGDGAFMMPNIRMPEIRQLMPMMPMMPMIPGNGARMFEMPNGGGTYYFHSGNGMSSDEIRQQVQKALEKVRSSDDIRQEVQKALEKARVEIERARNSSHDAVIRIKSS